MQKLSLDAMARELLERAAGAAGGRAAHTVMGGHEKVLRQTVIAMTSGAALAAMPADSNILPSTFWSLRRQARGRLGAGRVRSGGGWRGHPGPGQGRSAEGYAALPEENLPTHRDR